MKVMFHIDEVEKWKLLIKNVKALQVYGKAEHVTYHIEILVNAEAVEYVSRRKDDLQEVMEKLSEQGVLIKACYQSLVAFGIDCNELYSFVEVVDTGVAELTNKQAEGYAYIKP